MRAFLFAKATAARFLLLRSANAAPQCSAGFARCKTERAPWISKVRRYTSPRLLIPSKVDLPPLEHCRGTNPSQAESCRPFLKFLASPMLATRALAVRG